MNLGLNLVNTKNINPIEHIAITKQILIVLLSFPKYYQINSPLLNLNFNEDSKSLNRDSVIFLVFLEPKSGILHKNK